MRQGGEDRWLTVVEPIGEPPPEPIIEEPPLRQAPETGHSDSKGSDELDIVVDGERMKIKRSDYFVPGATDDIIIGIAQREKAAEKRLSQVNTLLRLLLMPRHPNQT
jgi:hypothetical protein